MTENPAWTPSVERIAAAKITHFAAWLKKQRGLDFADYHALWRWSVEDLEGFWSAMWDYFQIPGRYTKVLADARMPGAQWFPDTTVNYANQVFRHATDARPAIVFENEAGEVRELSWTELRRQVAAVAQSLRHMGVKPNDRIVAYLPNIPETIVAFLATVSVGAIWSACSPDMGKIAVLDRFRQIQPKVMFTVDGYRWGGKAYDRRGQIAELLAELPCIEQVIFVRNLDQSADLSQFAGAKVFSEASRGDAPLVIETLPFAHPLWVVYSSGTTGLPKPIVHSHGGIILEHLKVCALHLDVGADDRFNWFSTTGWIMWNCQVGGLLSGATACIYDGNPGWPDWNTLWRFAAKHRLTFFGSGAAFYASCLKAGISPKRDFDLSNLVSCGSTGSPLSPEAHQWIYDNVGRDIWVAPISGGTDFAGCFVGGVPTLPEYLGEMQCRCLGANVQAFDDEGRSVIDQVGELVCVAPMPSMPLYFWNDPNNQRYRDSYFDMYPGVWRHGDWLRITPRGGAIIYGRSDATINRFGVRMGTSELYRAVEDLPEVLDSLVVDLEYLGRESYMPLFVVLRDGFQLTPELKAKMLERIKNALSPRHVPNEVFAVKEVPRTLSGKKLELPVKNLLLGKPLEKIINRDAMANPASLDWFIAFAQQREAPHPQPLPPGRGT